MPFGGQQPDGAARSLSRRHVDAGDLPLKMFEFGAGQDPDAVFQQLADVHGLFVFDFRTEVHGVDLARDDVRDIGLHIHFAADTEKISLLDARLLHAVDEFRKEGIFDGVHHHEDLFASLAEHGARGQIGHVI